MEQRRWADRGQLLKIDPREGMDANPCMGASRLGSVLVSSDVLTVWVQLRGAAWLDAREGRFRLRAGQWIVLERESHPLIQMDRCGLGVGVVLDAGVQAGLARFVGCHLFAGRGDLDYPQRQALLRLWRQVQAGCQPAGPAPAAALRPLMITLADLQGDMEALLSRCPGRSNARKRQVFARMQRARLFMEGNCDRIIRITELAELTSFSSWYFSRTYFQLYGESPQAACARLRLEHAAGLLRDTKMMVGEVAAASGFDNCCSFARAFRARYGVSASHYRGRQPHARTHSAQSVNISSKAATASGK